MREIRASEAKTHLPRLLDEVEGGETLVITRHGRAIARIVPELDRQQEKIDEAMDAIRTADPAGSRSMNFSPRVTKAAEPDAFCAG